MGLKEWMKRNNLFKTGDKEIDDLIELLMAKTRHLLLPFDDADSTTFSEEDFFRQSGLL